MRRALLATAVLVAAVALIHLGAALLPGRILFDPTETRDLYRIASLYERTAETVLAGHLPLYTPEFQGGIPAYATWMYGLLYPPILLFGVLSAGTAWVLLAALHAAWAAAGMFRLIHSLRGDRTAAAAAAVVLGTAEFLVGRTIVGHLNLVMAFAWAPWVLDAAGRAGRGERGSRTYLAVTTFVGLLAGHAQLWFYVLPLASAWAVHESVRTRRGGGGRRPLVAAALPGFVLGAAMAAVQWAPAAEFASLGGHVQLEPDPAWSLQGTLLAEKLAPGALGRRPEDPWGLPAFDHESLALAGAAPILLALAGLLRRRSGRVFWGVAALVSILAALGSTTPVGALFDALPGVGLARTPGRAIVVAVLAAAVLAGHAVADFRERNPAARRRTLLATLAAGGGLLLASAAGLTLRAGAVEESRLFATGLPALAWSVLGAAAVFLALRLAVRRPRFAFALPAALALAALAGGVPPATAVSSAFYEHDWLGSLPPECRDHRSFILNDRIPLVERQGGRTLREIAPADARWYERFLAEDVMRFDRWIDVAAVAWPPEIGEGGDEFAGPWRNRVGRRPALGPALFFRSAAVEPSDDAVMAELRVRAEALYLAEAPTGGAGDPVASEPAAVSVERGPGPRRVRATLDAPADGFLWFSEKQYPGWRAKVDGRPVPVHRANVTFVAVPVPAGRHVVELLYAPTSFAVGAGIAGAAALVLLALALAGRRRRTGPDQGSSRASVT